LKGLEVEMIQTITGIILGLIALFCVVLGVPVSATKELDHEKN